MHSARGLLVELRRVDVLRAKSQPDQTGGNPAQPREMLPCPQKQWSATHASIFEARLEEMTMQKYLHPLRHLRWEFAALLHLPQAIFGDQSAR